MLAGISIWFISDWKIGLLFTNWKLISRYSINCDDQKKYKKLEKKQLPDSNGTIMTSFTFGYFTFFMLILVPCQNRETYAKAPPWLENSYIWGIEYALPCPIRIQPIIIFLYFDLPLFPSYFLSDRPPTELECQWTKT